MLPSRRLFAGRPNQAFLIRSYSAEYEDGEQFSGTQVIGWDPLAKQIRTWVFNSDGSYGDGTVARHGQEWSVRMAHMQTDGRIATATHVINRLDDDTMEIQKIGEAVDGEPVPSSPPIKVVRVTDAADGDATVSETSAEGATR